jgi:hypothetical protein
MISNMKFMPERGRERQAPCERKGGMDCHVATPLAMTEISPSSLLRPPPVSKPRGRVILNSRS